MWNLQIENGQDINFLSPLDVHQIKDFKRTIVTQHRWNSKKYRHGWTENTEQVTPQYIINNREACSNSHQMLILKNFQDLKTQLVAKTSRRKMVTSSLDD